MQLLEVPPKSGYVWLRQGIWLFRKNPLAILTLLFAYLFGVMLLSIPPVVGAFLPLLFIPGLSVGFMAACRDIIKSKQVLPNVLLDGFRGHGKEVSRRLLILGGYYIVAMAAVFLFSALFDGGDLLNKMLFGGRISEESLVNGSMGQAMLAAAVAYVPVAMMFWFAPVLVAWHDVTPVKALFFSWTACVRNLRAFFVYGLCTAVVATVLPLIVALTMAAMGVHQYAMLILMPYSILFTAVLYCSFYATYRGCFGVQEIGAIDPNVAPPEA
ncbi:membrane protein [Pandoraea communis]|uniref:Membrane protein n=1 Tax=Pandoraea communis TaxID=2508297 RepID=A0A5E4UH07_9BURK|nr:BPSS1780 family membrane protein [Pandoraea communis]VVD99287.1 membrane protein [Pandoraea communis]